ncbi:patatin-like phospholipase family protein [Lachnospiraceae bacterium LCP25S3_G4]
MKGIGLVFAGGGGKGSYEIGVWKYLHEMGLEAYVSAVSGTSVGALNAALFTGSSYELAEDLWLNIEPDKILTPKKVSPEDIIKWLAINGLIMSNPLLKGLGKASSIVASKTITGVETIAQMMLTRIRADYLFSRDGLASMISDGLNFQLLRESGLPCFITCLKCPNMEVRRFKLNEYCNEDITRLLLASSAIPIIFPNEEFEGEKYCDGGVPIVGDNIPIQPVYETGVENIIIIHLSQDAVIDKNQFPKSNIIEIVPSTDLGNALTGTLDFTADGSSKRIDTGYKDAKRIMQPLLDMLVLKAENQKMLKVAQQKNMEFERKRVQLIEKEQLIKQSMFTDDFDNLYVELMKEK